MSIVVRDLSETDYEDWIRLFDLYLKFYKTELDLETKRGTFLRMLDENVPMWGAIAIDEGSGKAVGIANYLRHLSTWSITVDKLYLNDLYVDEGCRTSGIGRKLVEYVYAKGDEMGASDVYWSTDMNNHRAQLLYTKVGKFSNKVKYIR